MNIVVDSFIRHDDITHGKITTNVTFLEDLANLSYAMATYRPAMDHYCQNIIDKYPNTTFYIKATDHPLLPVSFRVIALPKAAPYKQAYCYDVEHVIDINITDSSRFILTYAGQPVSQSITESIPTFLLHRQNIKIINPFIDTSISKLMKHRYLTQQTTNQSNPN